MSKVGKKPIMIPAGVNVNISQGLCSISKGAEKIDVALPLYLQCVIENNQLTVNTSYTRDKQMPAMWGTCRALIANAVKGLHEKYEQKLELKGVGYKVEMAGKQLKFKLGKSHFDYYDIPAGVEIQCTTPTTLTLKSHDKHFLGQVTADIRRLKKHNRYQDTGIHKVGVWRYTAERKTGK